MKYLSSLLLPMLTLGLMPSSIALASPGPDVSCSYSVYDIHADGMTTVPNRPVISVSPESATGTASGIISTGTFVFDNEGPCAPVEVVGVKAEIQVKNTDGSEKVIDSTTQSSLFGGVFYKDGIRIFWNANRSGDVNDPTLRFKFSNPTRQASMTLSGSPVDFEVIIDAAEVPSGTEYQTSLAEVTYRVGGRLITEKLSIPANPIHIE